MHSQPGKIDSQLTVQTKSHFSFCLGKNPASSTKDEAIEADPEPTQFVRAYRDRNGCFKSNTTSQGMRMSMAIRPQTVSNLASKFDSIINEKTPLTKSNSRQLKLRTYDISKIITELNKLNSDLDSNSAPVAKNDHKSGNKTAADDKSANNSQNKRCDGEDVKKTQQFNKVGKTTVNPHDNSGDTSEDSCGEKHDHDRSSPTKKTSSGNHNSCKPVKINNIFFQTFQTKRACHSMSELARRQVILQTRRTTRFWSRAKNGELLGPGKDQDGDRMIVMESTRNVSPTPRKRWVNGSISRNIISSFVIEHFIDN